MRLAIHCGIRSWRKWKRGVRSRKSSTRLATSLIVSAALKEAEKEAVGTSSVK